MKWLHLLADRPEIAVIKDANPDDPRELILVGPIGLGGAVSQRSITLNVAGTEVIISKQKPGELLSHPGCSLFVRASEVIEG